MFDIKKTRSETTRAAKNTRDVNRVDNGKPDKSSVYDVDRP